MRYSLLVSLLFSTTAFAQSPTITQVLDGGGYTPDIPPGAVFVVKGTNLSASGYVPAGSVPLPTSLNNVSMTFTPAAGGGAIPVYMLYTYNLSGVNQLAAVLPSTAATGAYDVKVTNNGAPSAAFRVNVVARKFGIVTADGSGSGEAQATLTGGLILQRKSNQGKIGQFDTRPGKPGERMDLWGTGLGADIPSDTGVGTSGDQTTAANVRVLVDGAEVTPLYAGRSAGSPGLDQIVFIIPTNVTLSCTNAVQVRAGGVLSNMVTIATSNTDTCPAPTNNTNTTPTQAEINAWIAQGMYRFGMINLDRSTSLAIQDTIGATGVTTTTTTTKSDGIDAEFYRYSGADLSKLLNGEYPAGYPLLTPAAGNCTVYNLLNLPVLYPNLTYRGLDAGPQLTSQGPNGTQPVPRKSDPTYGYSYATGMSLPNTYLSPGNYTVSGPGGADVGAFSGSIAIANDLVVTNPDELKVITRGSGATVRWTGGEPNTLIKITGSSIATTATGQTAAWFVCVQNISAGTFTVPASILNQLPASVSMGVGSINFVTRGSFGVYSEGKSVRLTIPNMDFVLMNNSWSWSVTPEYK